LAKDNRNQPTQPAAPRAEAREAEAAEAPRVEAAAPQPAAQAVQQSATPKPATIRVKALVGMMHNWEHHFPGTVITMTVAEAERREKRGEVELID
jgi:hypothetical protein